MELIKKIIAIEYERYKIHKAMRILQKQEWSVEFLAMVLRKAVDNGMTTRGVSLEIRNGNNAIVMKVEDKVKELASESIFDQLDNTAAVNAFIAAHSTRG